MVNYVVIKKNEKNAKPISSNTYGICACQLCDGLLDVIQCVYGISDDVVWLKDLAGKLNLYHVDPIHLCNIIEDELYNVRA